MTLTKPAITRPLHSSPAEHREALTDEFVEAFRAKYDKGQDEHGGLLYEKDCSKLAEEEVLDFWSYIKTMNEQRAAAIALIEPFVHYTQLQFEHPIAQALALLKGVRQDR